MSNFPMLNPQESDYLKDLMIELEENKLKNQIYRTETEMRYSVLNDGAFPTKASKYWQSVREMAVMYKQIRLTVFNYKEELIKIEQIKRKIQKCKDDLEIQLLEIEIDRMNFNLEDMRRTASDRVREITIWSGIKKELDDGSFNTKEVNEHQKDSYIKKWENRMATLTQGSSQAEVLNVLGPLSTITEDYNYLLQQRKDGVTDTNKPLEEKKN